MDINIVFRLEASPEIGMGHASRCRVLAQQWHERGAGIFFLCSAASWGRVAAPGIQHLQAETDEEAVALLAGLTPRPNWLVIDHYLIDVAWEQQIRPWVKHLMVIDDIARMHACDLLLDQNLFDDPQARYRERLSPGCKRLLGPDYALLRPSILAARHAPRAAHAVPRVFVCFGGGDTYFTERALAALPEEVVVDCVIGAGQPGEAQIAAYCAERGWRLGVNHPTPEEWMVQADFAIGAGGVMNWERCALGLPTIVISIADNQREICETLAARRVIDYLGHAETVDTAMIHHAAMALMADAPARAAMRARGMALVDGAGAARVVEAMAAF